jgi:hypothetical protein
MRGFLMTIDIVIMPIPVRMTIDVVIIGAA